MKTTKIGFARRLALAWRILFNAAVAGQAFAKTQQLQDATQNKTLTDGQAAEHSDDTDSTAAAPALDDRQAGAAQLLALLQREGRFVDFVSEDISGFADAEVGAAARAVHQGCAKVFRQHLQIKTIRSEAENTALEIPADFDPTRLSLSGQLQGAPPYRGRLVHPGWELQTMTLPTRQTTADKLFIISPAEVEI